MLELPESTTLARQMREHLSGATIVSAEAGHTPHGFAFYRGDPSDYRDLLEGTQIQGAAAYGSMTEMELSQGVRLLFNDGANVRLLPADAKVPAKHQLLLGLSDGRRVVVTIQMYAGILAYHEGDAVSPYYDIARVKPSPLGSDFTDGHWQTLLHDAKPSLSAKAFLATEQRIPGLGNGVLQDILLLSGIHPRTKLAQLSQDDRDRLLDAVRGVLGAMTEAGGRDTEKDLLGQPGGYRTLLSAKTLPFPCPHCGGALVRQAYLGGNVYFCPHCQPLKV